MAYTFTCPLKECNNQVMISHAHNAADASAELTTIAELHLKHVHPQVIKTHDAVAEDIVTHMVGKE